MRGNASLCSPLGRSRLCRPLLSRYVDARTNAPAINAAELPGGVMHTSRFCTMPARRVNICAGIGGCCLTHWASQ
jgi:hypothetical protein